MRQSVQVTPGTSVGLSVTSSDVSGGECAIRLREWPLLTARDIAMLLRRSGEDAVAMAVTSLGGRNFSIQSTSFENPRLSNIAHFLAELSRNGNRWATETTSSSSMSGRDDYLKLAPALRPYFYQITGVVWAVSWRRGIRKGTFHDDFLFPVWAVGAENVSCPDPVSLALRLAIRGDCLGNLLRAVQPPAQFLGYVPVDNSDLIFITVIVRHVFPP
jgi:hypothetical protein